jgi:SAM-dependent methyltransferase
MCFQPSNFNQSHHSSLDAYRRIDYIKLSIIYKSYIKVLRKVLAESVDEDIRVLDYGCSRGALLSLTQRFVDKQYPKKRLHLFGIDVSENALAYAKKKLPSASFYQVSDENTPLPCEPKSFHLVVSTQVLEHIVDPQLALIKINHLLRDKGALYISCPNSASVASWYLQERWHSHPHRFPEHISIKSFYEYRTMLAESGFSVVRDGTSGLGSISRSPLRIRTILSIIILTLFGAMLNWPCGESYYCFAKKVS